MTPLEEYYNKFNEEKRLDSRHGQIEYRISMKYIHDYLKQGDKIIDIGAGTGRYSIPLFEEGYDVTAVELVQHNLGRLKQKNKDIKAYKGNAMKLKRFKDNTFDMALLFGPMYHLFLFSDKLAALREAERVVKPGGIVLVAYVMNDYSVIRYAFKENHIDQCLEEGRFDEDYKIIPSDEDLYDYVRLEDINSLNAETSLERIKLISPDGPANYIRPFVNALTDQGFEELVKYQLANCERPELVGAGAHTVDILRKV